MANGIIKTEQGFAVKDFETGRVEFEFGNIKYPSYMAAVDDCCGKYYPVSYRQYLSQAARLESAPDADTWENMIYAGDPRGVWDGERQVYRSVTSMDRGAATEDEIAYVDALDATYQSLMAMSMED